MIHAIRRTGQSGFPSGGYSVHRLNKISNTACVTYNKMIPLCTSYLNDVCRDESDMNTICDNKEYELRWWDSGVACEEINHDDILNINLNENCQIHDKHRNLKQTRELMERKELHMTIGPTKTRFIIIIQLLLKQNLKNVISESCLQVFLSYV